MNPKLRSGTREDAAACGLIDFEAFKSISSQHNFPWDFPSVEAATREVTMMLSHPGFYSVVAEMDGKVVGSNFLDERNPISGVGPISVDPAVQNQTIGRLLMRAVMDRSEQRGFAGIRLVQSAYHNRSLCLYTKLGFETREPLSKILGTPPKLKLPGTTCGRPPMRETSMPAINCVAACTVMTVAASFATRSIMARPESSNISEKSPAMRRRSLSSRTRSARPTRRSRRSSAQRRRLAAAAFCCRPATASCFDGVSKAAYAWCIR